MESNKKFNIFMLQENIISEIYALHIGNKFLY